MSDLKQLAEYTLSEIKSLIRALGEKMTKAEKFEKAWRLGFKGDFSLVDEIYTLTINLSTTERVLKQTSKMTR